MAIKPSWRFAILLLLFHTITAVVVYATAVSPMVRLAMFLLISLSLFYHLARDVLLLLPGSWSEISLDRGSVAVATQDGSHFDGLVAGRSIVSPYFAVLCIRSKGRMTVSRVVFPYALGAGEFRELCVRLRFA